MSATDLIARAREIAALCPYPEAGCDGDGERLCEACPKRAVWEGETPPRYCPRCERTDVEICCTHATYDDGSHDDAECRDCCTRTHRRRAVAAVLAEGGAP